MSRRLRVKAARPSSTVPNEIAIDDDGAAVAHYGGEPLLRFDTLDDLVRRLGVDGSELIDVDV